jgi:hypothetical protein
LSHPEKSHHLPGSPLQVEELADTQFFLAFDEKLKLIFLEIATISTFNLLGSSLRGFILGLLLMMSLRKLGVDDSQGQVQQKEGTDEHQGEEVDED